MIVFKMRVCFIFSGMVISVLLAVKKVTVATARVTEEMVNL